MIIPAPASLGDQDRSVLNLLRLAAEAISVHPEAVSPDPLSLLDAYAADLYGTLAPGRAGKSPRHLKTLIGLFTTLTARLVRRPPV